eukprot:scaffold499226_cov43-Attheya_sp.AAC.1
MWDLMFSHLLKFIEENGHARVPRNYLSGDIQLGRWVSNQQKSQRNSKIRDDRRRRLEAVGFLWVRIERCVLTSKERTYRKVDESWNRMYQHLVDFKKEHDHWMVPIRTWLMEEDDDGGGTSQKDLSTWIDQFSLSQRQWDEMYERLKSFKEEHGHCRISVDYESDPALGNWVKNQRLFEKKGELDESRFEKLDCPGFVWWYQVGTRWGDMLEKLKAFKDEHGHCQVPARCPTDRSLGTWVLKQRTLEYDGTLDDKKFHLLNEVGFMWDPVNTRWNIMLNHLRDYTRDHGNVMIPTKYVTVDGMHLGSWARTQRSTRNSTKRKSHLTPKRIAELDDAGFVWDYALEEQWNTMYESLKKYKEENGHIRVPYDYKC